MIIEPTVNNVLIVAIFVCATAFIIVLGLDRRGAWRFSTFGWSLMIMTVGIWLFTALSLTRRILGPDYMGRDTVRTIAFAAILFGIASRLWVLVVEKWREREKIRRK